MDRTNINDSAILFVSIDLMFYKKLSGKEYTFKIDIHNRIEILLRYIPKIGTFFNPRIINQNIDRAKIFDVS